MCSSEYGGVKKSLLSKELSIVPTAMRIFESYPTVHPPASQSIRGKVLFVRQFP